MTNSAATTKREMDLILIRYNLNTFLFYLNDFIIYYNSIEYHIRHVEDILQALGDPGVTVKLNKCTLLTDSVEYLGQIIWPGSLEIDSTHTRSLCQAAPPTNKTKNRSFMGLCNVYRRFVQNLALVAAPLN